MNPRKSLIPIALLIFALACGDDSKSKDDGPNSDPDVIDQSDASGDRDSVDEQDTSQEQDAAQTPDTDLADGTDPAGTVSVEQFQTRARDALINIYCHAIFECPEQQDPALFTVISRTGDYNNCLLTLDKLMPLGNAFEEQKLGIEEGRISFDSQAAARCLEATEQLPQDCRSLNDLLDDLNEACNGSDRPFIGHLELDEPCLRSDECASGYCDNLDDSTCYGHCAPELPRAQEGESCDNGTMCAAGLSCATKSVDGSNYQNVCIKRGSVSEGDACYFLSSLCQEGYLCEMDLSANSTCVPDHGGHQAGETCDRQSQYCKPGLVCINADPTSPQAGGTCTLPVAAGGECDIYTACEPGLYCAGALILEHNGVCQPQKSPGDDCEDELDECGLNAFCNPNSSKCEANPDIADCELPEP